MVLLCLTYVCAATSSSASQTLLYSSTLSFSGDSSSDLVSPTSTPLSLRNWSSFLSDQSITSSVFFLDANWTAELVRPPAIRPMAKASSTPSSHGLSCARFVQIVSWTSWGTSSNAPTAKPKGILASTLARVALGFFWRRNVSKSSIPNFLENRAPKNPMAAVPTPAAPIFAVCPNVSGLYSPSESTCSSMAPVTARPSPAPPAKAVPNLDTPFVNASDRYGASLGATLSSPLAIN